MTDLLLTLILATLLGVIWGLAAIRRQIANFVIVWGNNPAHASDYHAKEQLKTLQEIAHYAAIAQIDRREDVGPQ